MAGKSSIEWCTHTWNPTVGCSRVSPGCDHCYAMTQAPRQAGKGLYEGVVEGGDWTGNVNLGDATHLDWPLRRCGPRSAPMRVFVNSMSDLFHENIPVWFIARVWARMGLANKHRFMVLTKRGRRMQEVLSSDEFREAWWQEREERAHQPDVQRMFDRGDVSSAAAWPVPNIMVGVSVESPRYTFRVRQLRDTPAALRFVSAEPLLGLLGPIDLRGVDWLIAGGESGQHARPMHPDWARELRDTCGEQGVAFLFKQWGSWRPRYDLQVEQFFAGADRPPGHFETVATPWTRGGAPSMVNVVMEKIDKHTAGRELDGRTWDDYPGRDD